MAGTSSSRQRDSLSPYAYPLWSEGQIPEALAAAGLPEARIREELNRLAHRVFAVGGLNRTTARRLQELAAAAGCSALQAGEGGLGARRSTKLLVHGTLQGLLRLGRALEVEGKELAEVGREILWSLETAPRALSWGRRRIELGSRPLVMGILNCTPDSFYPGSRLADASTAVQAAARLVDEGADILDVGGESTRPGSEAVDADEELKRVIPVIEGIRRGSDVLISIDTRKRAVAEAALEAGADLVNDIAAMSREAGMLRLVAERGVPVVLMHMRGEPKTMQVDPHYDDAVSEIICELAQAVDFAVAAGVERARIILDPGIGFGKRCQDNLAVLGGLRAFACLGRPLLIGLSRKSFLGTLLDEPVEQRLAGTIVANTLAAWSGADILRVHDVREAVQMARIVEAVRLGSCGERAPAGDRSQAS